MRAIGAGGEQQAMKSALIRPIAILAVAGMAMLAFAQQKKPAAFYYRYCGHKAASVATLTASMCIRHPNAPHKGNHEAAR